MMKMKKIKFSENDKKAGIYFLAREARRKIFTVSLNNFTNFDKFGLQKILLFSLNCPFSRGIIVFIRIIMTFYINFFSITGDDFDQKYY